MSYVRESYEWIKMSKPKVMFKSCECQYMGDGRVAASQSLYVNIYIENLAMSTFTFIIIERIVTAYTPAPNINPTASLPSPHLRRKTRTISQFSPSHPRSVQGSLREPESPRIYLLKVSTFSKDSETSLRSSALNKQQELPLTFNIVDRRSHGHEPFSKYLPPLPPSSPGTQKYGLGGSSPSRCTHSRNTLGSALSIHISPLYLTPAQDQSRGYQPHNWLLSSR